MDGWQPMLQREGRMLLGCIMLACLAYVLEEALRAPVIEEAELNDAESIEVPVSSGAKTAEATDLNRANPHAPVQ